MTIRSACLLPLLTCLSCSIERPPDCSDENVEEFIIDLFLRPALASAHLAVEGYSLYGSESVVESIMSLVQLEETPEIVERLEASRRSISKARSSTLTLSGIRRDSQNEVSLECECTADLHIDGKEAVSNFKYDVQYTLDGRLYGRAWNYERKEFVDFIEAN